MTVSGTTTSINTDDLFVKDNTITLNDGEAGPGITAGTAGIEIDRGDGVTAGHETVFIKYDESVNGGVWTLDNGQGSGVEQIATASGGSPMFNLIDDLTPQVGGTGGLDMRTNSITTSDLGQDVDILMPLANSNDITLNTSNASSNIVLTVTGLNGEIIMAGPVLLQGAAPNTTPASGEAALFKGAETGGGTQVHYQNDTDTGELVSKRKALAFSLIF